MARSKSRGRPVHGVVLVDKPQGMTSHTVVQRVRKCFQAARAGHTGALDPLATGLLPVCLGEATKFGNVLLESDKGYEAIARLGQTTDTGDADGQVLDTRPVPLRHEVDLDDLVRRFSGVIEQIPPMYSALKHKGTPLHKLARQGVEVERAPRPVTIHALNLAWVDDERLKVTVRCSKGTYIRVLVEDMGRVLGCGAHVEQLRRTEVAGLQVSEAVPLDVLSECGAPEDYLLPVDTLVQHLPVQVLDSAQKHSLLHGQPVTITPRSEAGDVRLYGPGGEFIGLGIAEGAQLRSRRLVSTDYLQILNL
ncbi:tRNA pseudouridine(55) synthase TruB [Hahella sp. SMD15-11]|uniref:tRNA pseudouridine synthase B n=1 Tax=Thermohahella caldifontis TaxID=3142973 RepID=A0AB39UVW1_9GAMM